MNIKAGNFLVGKTDTSVALRVLSLRKDGVLVKMLDSSMETYAIGSEFLVKNEHLKAYQVIGFSKEDLNTEYVKGKTEGYNEGYQHGFTLAKEKITELGEDERNTIFTRGLKEGYQNAKKDNLHQSSWVQGEKKKSYQEGYNKAIEDKKHTIVEARKHHYDMGYNDALAHMASEEAENTLELKKQGYEEGYAAALSESDKPDYKQGLEEGFDKGYNAAIKGMRSDEALGEECENKFGTEGCCESHNLNKETEEAMQEVLDKVQKSIEDMKTFLKQFNEKDGEDGQLEKELALVEKYPHYYKDIRHLNIIDIYRFFDLFEVTDPCIQHSVKKLAVGGKRGAKDYEKDIKEAMDTLKRWEYMQEENKRGLDD